MARATKWNFSKSRISITKPRRDVEFLESPVDTAHNVQTNRPLNLAPPGMARLPVDLTPALTELCSSRHHCARGEPRHHCTFRGDEATIDRTR